MITFLHGKLVESSPTQVTVDVHGVGYEVLIPLSSFDKLPAPGGEVHLLTHLVVREDAHVLYGFMTAVERDMFRLLINTVSGIGPKLALNVLSGMNVVALRGAVAGGDVKSLSQISGVGKKTAERKRFVVGKGAQQVIMKLRHGVLVTRLLEPGESRVAGVKRQPA